jgi:hypothetical protein
MALMGGSRGVIAEPVGIWLFDENKGDAVKDATGKNKDDGKFIGGVKWDSGGKHGSALKFDGATGHVEIPDPDHRLTPPNITLMAWVRMTDVGGTHSILEQYDWAGTFGCHAFRTTGAQLQLWVIWGPAGDNIVGGSLKADTWHHVAGTYDGQNIRVFIDGKLVGEKAGAKKNLAPSSKSLSIGVRGDTKDVHWFGGLIDEAAVFDTALTEKEIAAIANNPGGLSAQFLAVSPQGKSAMTWGTLKHLR